jgi:putative flavoprotein involved in K+ transport
MAETVDYLVGYQRTIAAPVETSTMVTSVSATEEGYRVVTDRGDWACSSLVIASGACNLATVPAFAAAVPTGIATLTPLDYRNPDQLEAGRVLVAGASATGIQLADEIHRSGREVVLAVGEHVRAPRLYRGRDIQWWMDKAGVLDDRYDEVDDIVRARRVPSLQLVGSREREILDLNALTEIGVKLVGRFAGIVDGKAQFSGSLRNQCALADLKLTRLLDRIDEWATLAGIDGEVPPPHRFKATEVEASPPLGMDLAKSGVKTILWATGFRPDHSWLHIPVFDRKGHIRHDGGIVGAPGMYLMGIPFLRRRKSSLIDGAADDARDLSDHLLAYLDGKAAPALAAAQ